jgi:outer membrane protein insertion porin family
VSGMAKNTRTRNASGIKIAMMTLVAVLLLGATGAMAEGIEGGRYHVGSVRIAGNKNVTEAAVLAKVRSRTGELFLPEVAAEDAKRMAEVKGIQYAYYNTELKDDKVDLTFVVIERLIVRGIVFNGNKKYGDSSLEKKLNFKRGDYLDKLMVEAGLKDMIEFYREKGYAFAEVAVDKNELETGRVVYNVNEGPRVKVTAIKFSGNRLLKSGNLRDVVKVSVRKWLFFQGHYHDKQVEEDVIRLQKTYLKRGFLDVKVSSSTDFSPDKGKVRITFIIEEGPIYTVRQLAIKGNEFFTEEDLTSDLKLKTGEVFTPEKAEFDTKKIRGKYQSTGFIDVGVEQSRAFAGPAQVDAKFDITQGDRFKIGKVNITGNDQTQDKVVRRILDEQDFSPGQWYNAAKADGSGQADLEKTVNAIALTQSTVISPSGDKPGVRDAQVSVTEGMTGMVMVGAGVSTDSGVVGQLVFEQRNFDISAWPASFGDFASGKAFKGAGQIFRISLEPGTEYSQFSVSFTEPYLNDKPIAMTIGASRYIRGQEAYDELRTKGYIDFEKRYKNGWRAGVGFRIEQVTVSNVDANAPSEISDWRGSNMLLGVRPHFGYDTTDDRFYPTKGFFFNTGIEQVTGDATFTTLDGTFRWYKTVAEDFFERKTVLATKLQAGVTSAAAPPFEKFYAGGTGSMRGFEYHGVSKRAGEDEVPVGSDWIFLANTELAVPLNSEVFSALFFVDSGTVQTGPYRIAVGTGLQIMVPQILGPVPMRFEFAVPLRKDDKDETRVFSFSITRLF